jgi:signal transduction histidine kinase
MIEDLLQIARLSDAAAPIQKGRILLGPLLDECGEENRLIVEHSGRTFQLVKAEDAAGRWLHGDRSLVKRLIGNLILNAIDHSPQGAAVTFGARPCADSCRVEVFVHNDGPAIPQAHLGAIFRKFTTFGESARNVGLGLAFCKMAAEKHAAAIAVSSEDQTGTIFCVRFLVGQTTAAAPARALGEPAGAFHAG